MQGTTRAIRHATYQFFFFSLLLNLFFIVIKAFSSYKWLNVFLSHRKCVSNRQCKWHDDVAVYGVNLWKASCYAVGSDMVGEILIKIVI